MKRGGSLLITIAMLLFIGTSSLIADELVQNLTSAVIENFDDPDNGRWVVQASKFVAEGYPLTAYAPAWPEALFGRNKNGDELKALGVQAAFDRRGYNYLEFVPVAENQQGEIEHAPITLPGRVRSIDFWVWGSNYDYFMETHVRDYTGRVHVLKMGGIKFVGWQNLNATVPRQIPQAGGYITPGGFIKNLELLKVVLWTKPTENVSGFNIYIDQIKILTDTFVTRFDGDELADPEYLKEIWSNAE